MWHEARKQERKIRGMLVDYRKRAERRRDFYEKIKADPTQFLQIHGRQCKIHLDPAIAAAADGPAAMMPWQGQTDNLIDRFDVRAHLDFIPPVASKIEEEITAEERQLNYERYRIIAQNAFLGINEEKFLKQLHMEEQFGYTEHEPKKKKLTGGAAIGFNYEDSTGGSSFAQSNLGASAIHEEDVSDDNSDSDLDVDLSINISKIDSTQAHEMNRHGRNFGMSSNDFYSYLTNDLEEAESFKLAKEEEHEKALFSGRKSRRERRAHREKKNAGRKISPPSYAAKETIVNVEMHEKSESRSPSPENSGKITFITSFGDDEEPQLPVKTTYADKVKFGTKLKKLRQENCDRKVFLDTNRREPINFKRKVVDRDREPRIPLKKSLRRSVSRIRKIRPRSRRSTSSSSHSRSSRSRTRSRSRSRSRSARSRRSRSRNASSRRRPRRRSSSSSSSSSSYTSRKRSRRRRSRSRSSTSRSSRSSRSRSRLRSSKSRSRSSSSSSCRSRSVRSKTASKSKSASRSPTKKIEEPILTPAQPLEFAVVGVKMDILPNHHDVKNEPSIAIDEAAKEVKPLPRYYGRRKSDQSLSEIGESSDEDSTESPKNSLTNNSNLKIDNTGTATKAGQNQAKSSAMISLAERLKRKRQAVLNKIFKADKIAEQIKTEREKQEQQTREDELRELALKLRRRQRERRHAYDSDSSDSSSRSSRSKSASMSPPKTKRSRSRSRSASPTKKERRRGERERERERERDEYKDYSRRYSGSSRDYERDRDRERDRERDRDREREYDRERGREKSRSRDRERERERDGGRYRRSSLRNDDRYYMDERRRGGVDGRDGRARDNQNPRRSLVDY